MLHSANVQNLNNQQTNKNNASTVPFTNSNANNPQAIEESIIQSDAASSLFKLDMNSEQDPVYSRLLVDRVVQELKKNFVLVPKTEANLNNEVINHSKSTKSHHKKRKRKRSGSRGQKKSLVSCNLNDSSEKRIKIIIKNTYKSPEKMVTNLFKTSSSHSMSNGPSYESSSTDDASEYYAASSSALYSPYRQIESKDSREKGKHAPKGKLSFPISFYIVVDFFFKE